MKMSLVVDGLRSDVLSVGELGDDTVAEVAERIAELLGRSVPARILDLLSDVAAELSAELPEGRVEIRVAGDDVDLAYVEDEHAAPTWREAGDEGRGGEAATCRPASRLRLSEGLKSRVEEGAARQGISVNTYIVRTLERGTSASAAEADRAATACAATARPEGSNRTWTRHSRHRGGCASSCRTRSASWPSRHGESETTTVSIEPDTPGAEELVERGHGGVPRLTRRRHLVVVKVPQVQGCASCAATP